jgi:hypothetical protein
MENIIEVQKMNKINKIKTKKDTQFFIENFEKYADAFQNDCTKKEEYLFQFPIQRWNGNGFVRITKKEDGFSILENVSNWESDHKINISDLQKIVFKNRKYINLEIQRQKKDVEQF